MTQRPDWRVEIVMVVLYAAILFNMDKAAGYRTAAGWYLRGSRRMAQFGTWALTTSIRWENAAKELVTP